MPTNQRVEKLIGSELLAGILTLMPDHGRIAGKEKLHDLFYQIKRHYSILKEFEGFDTRWPQVWSKRLDEAFGWLSLFKVVRYDGEFHAFGITKSAGKCIKEEILPRFSVEQILQACEIADIISKSIVCHCNWCETIKKSPRM